MGGLRVKCLLIPSTDIKSLCLVARNAGRWKREDHSGSPASLSSSRFGEVPRFKIKGRVTEGLWLPHFACDHFHLHQKGGRRIEKRETIEQANSRLGREFRIDHRADTFTRQVKSPPTLRL